MCGEERVARGGDEEGRSGELGGLQDALADEFGLGALYAFEDVVDLLRCVEGVGLDDVLSWSS